VKRLEFGKEALSGGEGYIQVPPMTKGMKYQVRLRKSWYVWNNVKIAKRTIIMVAAALDGL
jgi:hypothetical protein